MIESSAATIAANMTETERQAIEIVWHSRGNGPTPIPENEALAILSEVRERASRIENKVVRTLYRAIDEGRRTPRRHQLFALLVIGSLLVIALLIAAVVLNLP
jgi:hypothetical protein